METAAQAVLAARAQYQTSKLADLYDPLTMPAPLLQAHQQLDRAVDRCYRPEPFPSDRHRVEYLFALYEQLTAPLVAAAKPARKGRRRPQTAPQERSHPPWTAPNGRPEPPIQRGLSLRQSPQPEKLLRLRDVDRHRVRHIGGSYRGVGLPGRQIRRTEQIERRAGIGRVGQ